MVAGQTSQNYYRFRFHIPTINHRITDPERALVRVTSCCYALEHFELLTITTNRTPFTPRKTKTMYCYVYTIRRRSVNRACPHVHLASPEEIVQQTVYTREHIDTSCLLNDAPFLYLEQTINIISRFPIFVLPTRPRHYYYYYYYYYHTTSSIYCARIVFRRETDLGDFNERARNYKE